MSKVEKNLSNFIFRDESIPTSLKRQLEVIDEPEEPQEESSSILHNMHKRHKVSIFPNSGPSPNDKQGSGEGLRAPIANANMKELLQYREDKPPLVTLKAPSPSINRQHYRLRSIKRQTGNSRIDNNTAASTHNKPNPDILRRMTFDIDDSLEARDAFNEEAEPRLAGPQNPNFLSVRPSGFPILTLPTETNEQQELLSRNSSVMLDDGVEDINMNGSSIRPSEGDRPLN